MIRNKYDQILDQFKMYYPSHYDRAIDWWASGYVSITVKLEDGDMYEFDQMRSTLRRVRPSDVDVDDETMAKEIGENLKKYIYLSNTTQQEIASKLGITNAMLSRYIHGTSMPNAGRAYRLAKILGCTIDELFDGSYMK